VQGKTERVSDVRQVLQEFYRDALTRLMRHQAAARLIRQYDANNAYQYIINRGETHLSWIAAAISTLGGQVDDTAPEPNRGSARDAAVAAMEEDARESRAFVDRWRPRVDSLPNARHAKMLGVILGEVLEQQRFFEQALAGRTDLLGRRGQHLEPAHGEVLPSRWIE
jgi:uncharacterized protein YbjQ (UPF0145 family)